MCEIPLETLNKIRASAEALAKHWPAVLDAPDDVDLAWALQTMYEADGGSALLGMTLAQYRSAVLDRATAVRSVAELAAQHAAERDWAVLQAAHGVRGYVVPLPAPQGRGGRGRGRRAPAKH